MQLDPQAVQEAIAEKEEMDCAYAEFKARDCLDFLLAKGSVESVRQILRDYQHWLYMKDAAE